MVMRELYICYFYYRYLLFIKKGKVFFLFYLDVFIVKQDFNLKGYYNIFLNFLVFI